MIPSTFSALASQLISDARRGHVCHVTGVRGAAGCLLTCQLLSHTEKKSVYVTADASSAQNARDDFRAFEPGTKVEVLPTPEMSPYEPLRSDRRVSMARAASLVAWDRGELDLLIVPIAAFVRKVPSREALARGTMQIRRGETLTVEELPTQLEAAGYQRVPLVEDPGTFTIRGDIVDIWPRSQKMPVRIELEFDRIQRMRAFDPASQVSSQEAEGFADDEILVPPAREMVITPEVRERAVLSVRTLCDALNLPTSQTRPLLEDIAQGRPFVGSDGLLPAYETLQPLSARFDADTLLVFEQGQQCVERALAELEDAETAYAMRRDFPACPPADHFVTRGELDASLNDQLAFSLHGLTITGPEQAGFEKLIAPHEASPNLDAQDHTRLTENLKTARQEEGQRAGLEPLAERLSQWLEEGLSVFVSARVNTQAERLSSLLEHRGFAVQKSSNMRDTPPGRLRIGTSSLARGFVSEPFGQVYLTEEEIFGRRVHRPRRRATRALRDALDDLRSLKPGDHVVHVEHGIGRYLGLSHKMVGETRVELLTVEYAAGDKLHLPVYRLNQIQKLSGAESAPRLDKLGGASFSKTKRQVKRKVREIADQLLRLYAERKLVRRPPLAPPGDDYAAFEAAFPYEETADQAAAITDVIGDLTGDTVMDRLVCGDVGFGKTEVALRAAYLNVNAGRQVALLCPTTVLAEQHFRTFESRLGEMGAVIRPLSRFQRKKQVEQTTVGLKQGQVDVVVGTHRLLSQDVHFENLGLLVVDEEQRFGVTHKERIKEMRKNVDVLTLTATPIPRTMGLAVSGLRDMSIISTPPVDRRTIRTFVAQFDEELMQKAVQRELERNGQVFYVYNRVEGIYERAALLQRLMPSVRVGVAHGQMSERALEKAMLAFVDGEFDVLVSTAIIESGLDIPRANTIIVDRADLFGLAQLYQIRGRVGRSAERAYCYLLVPPLSKLSSEAKSRIEALERHTDLGSGFQIANLDMELRGAGEILGADQSGFVTRVGLDLFTDMLEQATSELGGTPVTPDVDPDLSLDVEALIPEHYIDDVGVRLSLYKRFAQAESEEDVAAVTHEMADRFGQPPLEARRFAEVMRLKTDLRRLRVLGLSATKNSVTLHLRDDTPLSPAKLAEFVASGADRYTLSPGGQLTRRAASSEQFTSGLEHADRFLHELRTLEATG